MRKLLQFLYKYRAFGLFLVLEVLSFFIIIRNNGYQSSAAFNSSNAIAGSVLEIKKEFTDPFIAEDENERLIRENAELISIKQQLEAKRHLYRLAQKDPERVKKYRFIPAQVIKNEIHHADNYITLDIGTKDGVKPGMGVFNDEGIVGRVKSCSNNFSTVISFLHSDTKTSCVLEKNDELCTAVWPGKSYQYAELKYLPRHVNVKKGDTIITSGFNAVYPKGIPIGIVVNNILEDHQTFHNTKIKLLTNFNALNYVYVVDNKLKEEQTILEKQIEE